MTIAPMDDADFTASLGHSTGPRSAGLHLSTIYGRLLERLHPKKYDRSKPMDMRRIEIGLIFENMLERGLAEKFATVRPGEVISDEGIAMSPDGVNPDLVAGEEYKATFKSCRHGLVDEYGMPLPQFLGWFLQMKGYAKWLGVRRFILRVLFLNGDYSQPLTPQFRCFDIEFSDEEVEENWTMLMNFAKKEGMLV